MSEASYELFYRWLRVAQLAAGLEEAIDALPQKSYQDSLLADTDTAAGRCASDVVYLKAYAVGESDRLREQYKQEEEREQHGDRSPNVP